jgi:O-methyltransferase
MTLRGTVKVLASQLGSIDRHIWVASQLRRDIRPLTMASPSDLRDLTAAVDSVLRKGRPGCLVECGTWRGGASFLMARRAIHLRQARPVWMFDSFEGLPPPKEIDGPAANAWAADTASPGYYNNCAASLEEVQAAVSRLDLTDNVTLVKGWFQDTLASKKSQIGQIALLRIDADWYDSVLLCLEELVPCVVDGGVVMLDDYYTWDGCARATHDYLASHGLPYRIRRWGGGAFFVERPPTKDHRASTPE